MIKYTFPLLLLCSFSACMPTVAQKLKGTWAMQRIYDNSTEVTRKFNPRKDRWITFYEDGSFKSGGTPYGENGGKWTFYASDNLLFLDSDIGVEDDSYWILQIWKEEMNWSGARSSFTERFRVTFSRR